jgi:hypothetical protein
MMQMNVWCVAVMSVYNIYIYIYIYIYICVCVCVCVCVCILENYLSKMAGKCEVELKDGFILKIPTKQRIKIRIIN